MIYYTSDLHIGHKNALLFDDRPFADIDEMEAEIVRRWNEKVTDDDDVYILGDVFYRRKNKYKAPFLKQLRGRLHLIVGNHDSEMLRCEEAMACFASVDRLTEIIDGDRMVVLCHFPIISWNMRHHGSYHVYGHVHKQINELTKFMIKQERAFNAGCMINNFEPCTLEELEKNFAAFRETAEAEE